MRTASFLKKIVIPIKRFFQKDLTPYIVFAIPLIFLIVFLFWPLANTFIRAFMDKGSKFDLSHLNLSNFRKFLESPLYQKSLRNSFVLSISVMLFSLLIGIPMGYIVARVNIPAKNLFARYFACHHAIIRRCFRIILLGRQGTRHALNTFLPIGIELPPSMVYLNDPTTLTYYPLCSFCYSAFPFCKLARRSIMLWGLVNGDIPEYNLPNYSSKY